MVDEIIKKFSKKTESKFFINYNLRKLNWFNIGGKTKVFVDNYFHHIIFFATGGFGPCGASSTLFSFSLSLFVQAFSLISQTACFHCEVPFNVLLIIQ